MKLLRFFRTSVGLVLGLILMGTLASMTLAQKSNDSLAAKSDPKDALTEQLYSVAIATTSLEENLLFYRDGMGLSVRQVPVDKKTKKIQRKLWRISKDIDWDLYILERPDVPTSIKIRLMVLNKPTPNIHKSWNSLELGPFSLGFPNTNQKELDRRIRRYGFGSQAPLQNYKVNRPDGTKYNVYETIFNGPDFVKGVGIFRGDGMNQLSPVDKNGMGGPGYSAQIVNNSDEIIDFYVNVLGMELRADRVWTTSGALGAPAGTKYRFALIYAKGATHGHLLFVDYRNAAPIDPKVEPKIPNRGLGMWTFPVKDLDEVYKRAVAGKVTIIHKPKTYRSPLLGEKRVMTMLAPNGYLVELFENKR